ncbi:MAG TPA: hypothetical protein VII58_13210 [Acidobacteriaceae bacterium]
MDAYEFIQLNVDSVPHLEALMLLWNSRPVGWTCEEMASRLYIPFERVSGLLRDLVRIQLITESETAPSKFSYYSRSKEQDEMMPQVDEAYRRDLVRISTMLHEKSSPALRDFARAFQFKRQRE